MDDCRIKELEETRKKLQELEDDPNQPTWEEEYMTKEAIPHIEYQKKICEAKSAVTEVECWHKDYYGDSARERANQLSKLIKILKFGLKVKWDSTGVVIVDDKCLVSLNKKSRWRKIGAGTKGWQKYPKYSLAVLMRQIENGQLKENYSTRKPRKLTKKQEAGLWDIGRK